MITNQQPIFNVRGMPRSLASNLYARDEAMRKTRSASGADPAGCRKRIDWGTCTFCRYQADEPCTLLPSRALPERYGGVVIIHEARGKALWQGLCEAIDAAIPQLDPQSSAI